MKSRLSEGPLIPRPNIIRPVDPHIQHYNAKVRALEEKENEQEALEQAKEEQKKLLEELDQNRRLQTKRMQEIEALKFEDHDEAGLTHFDQLNNRIIQGKRELEGMRTIYKKNLNMLDKLER